MGLISYKGLAKVIAGLNDAEAWEVIGNAFNPTFEEVKAGKLEKKNKIEDSLYHKREMYWKVERLERTFSRFFIV